MKCIRVLALATLALFTAAFLAACDQKTGAGEPVQHKTPMKPMGAVTWNCEKCKTHEFAPADTTKVPECDKCKKPMTKGATDKYDCEGCKKSKEVDKGDAAPSC